MSFHWISTFATFVLFSLLLLVPQLKFGCLTAKLLVDDLENKSKKRNACQGRTMGNYYKLIQRIVILEGLEWSEINYSFYGTKCEFILGGEVASPASTYKDVNILHSTCGIQSCQLSFLSLSEILHSIWFIDSVLKLRCQRSWNLGIVLFCHLFQLWFGLDTEEVSLHLLNIIWWGDTNFLLLWNSKTVNTWNIYGMLVFHVKSQSCMRKLKHNQER